MIRLNIFNMNEFLDVVNKCTGPVDIITNGGTKININRNETAQLDLQKNHETNGKRLLVSLNTYKTEDYMNIVYFSIGDC